VLNKLLLKSDGNLGNPKRKKLDIILDLFAELFNEVEFCPQNRIVLVLRCSEPEIVSFVTFAAVISFPFLVFIQGFLQYRRISEIIRAVPPFVDECAALLLNDFSRLCYAGIVVASKEKLQIPFRRSHAGVPFISYSLACQACKSAAALESNRCEYNSIEVQVNSRPGTSGANRPACFLERDSENVYDIFEQNKVTKHRKSLQEGICNTG